MTSNKQKILLIDDAPVNLQVLTAALSIDFELQIATSGAKGLQLAEAAPPDLILLDVMMPEMDGFETCRRLKALPALRLVPVIFVSALDQLDDESAGLALGAADYITKPIQVGIARQRIRNLLEREDLRKQVEASLEHLEAKGQACAFALAIARESADAAHRVKTRFLNNMSHELRTPMTTIMGQMEVLMFSASDTRQGKLLATAYQASEALLALISNLVDITALEANQLTLASQPFTLQVLLNSLRVTYGYAAQRKNIELTVHADASLADLNLQGDALRLGQILMVLCDNAVKFTAQGSVSVQVSVSAQTPVDSLLRFEVRDTGIGIDPAHQKRIWGLFEQADNSSTRPFSGTGLGLALSRQLIGLMGGRYGLESCVGAGSLFWFTARVLKANQAVSPVQ